MTAVRHWGPHFPNTFHWGPHFPDNDRDPTLFNGFGPNGITTFVLDLESGFTLKLAWQTDIIPAYGGKEQRIATLDAPKQFYSRRAILQDSAPRDLRAKLARFAAIGSTFLLGLPYEELTLVADSSGTDVFVNPNAIGNVDWAKEGQRVVVEFDGSFVDAVIQEVSGGTITLDVSPGSVGSENGRIMPAMAVILSPQQNFLRYPSGVEEWSIDARAAIFDFVPDIAELELAPLTASAAFNDVIIKARQFGLPGNATYFGLFSGGPAAGSLVEADGEIAFSFDAGVTTLGDLRAALDTSSFGKMTGSWNDADTIALGDAFPLTQLTGGSAGGTVGSGASITTYSGRPVWDRKIQVDGAAGDSIHSMVEIIDLGGVPKTFPTTRIPDWGRQVRISRQSMTEWQWVKKFLWNVRGMQKSFWLPTWRDDLVYVSHSGTDMTITTSGDILAWWPLLRQHVQILQADGSITYTEVTAASDQGDGTVDLTLSTSLSVSPVTMVSWLEICRFSSDEFSIVFENAKFTLDTVARAVQR